MQIIVHGATGRMGQLICAAAGNEVTARISPGYPTSENGCWRTLAEYQGSADCVIDFSHHSATGALVDYCLVRGIQGKGQGLCADDICGRQRLYHWQRR